MTPDFAVAWVPLLVYLNHFLERWIVTIKVSSLGLVVLWFVRGISFRRQIFPVKLAHAAVAWVRRSGRNLKDADEAPRPGSLRFPNRPPWHASAATLWTVTGRCYRQ